MKWIYVIILETFTQINNNQMQRKNLTISLGVVYIVTTGPLRGSHDADVAYSENEFDAPEFNNST